MAGVPAPVTRATNLEPVVFMNPDGTVAPSGSSTSPMFFSAATIPAATDRSGTATTTSGGLTVAANASRKSLVGQNVGANNIGFNEFNGTAAIGTAGTYTVTPGSTFKISTVNAVTFVAATGPTAVTMTES